MFCHIFLLHYLASIAYRKKTAELVARKGKIPWDWCISSTRGRAALATKFKKKVLLSRFCSLV